MASVQLWTSDSFKGLNFLPSPGIRRRSFFPFDSIYNDLQSSLAKETLACDLRHNIKPENHNVTVEREITVTNFFFPRD